MRWTEYGMIFQAMLPRFAPPLDGPIPNIPVWLSNLTFEEIDQADEACRHFARTLGWPGWECMSLPNVHFAIFFRLMYATECVHQFALEGEPEPSGNGTADLEKVLVAILVNAWDQEWKAWAEDRFPSAD